MKEWHFKYGVGLSLCLHLVIGVFLTVNFKFQPKPPKLSFPEEDIVTATVIDEQIVNLELEKIREQELRSIAQQKAQQNKLQQQKKELKKLAEQKKKLKKEKERAEQQKQQVQREQEAIKKQKKQAEQELVRIEKQKEQEQIALAVAEEKRLAEEQRLVEKKRLAEEEQKKRQSEQLKRALEEEARALEKKRLAEEEQKKRQSEQLKRALEEEARALEKKKEQQRLLAEKKNQKKLEQEWQAKQDTELLRKTVNNIRSKIINNFVLTGLPEGLSCRLQITVVPGGEVINVNIAESSGNPIFDRRVVTAVEKSSPLPVPLNPVDFERLGLGKMSLPFEP